MVSGKKNLAAGIREMRSVAKRLNAWADDLEKSMAGGEDPPAGSAPDEEAQTEVPAEVVSAPAVVAAPVAPAPPTLAEVKAFLTGRCAAGYSAQVKALIASFGAASLSEVPKESLGDLLDAALLIGQEDADGDGHAG